MMTSSQVMKRGGDDAIGREDGMTSSQEERRG
jgi:hypothetical protein